MRGRALLAVVVALIVADGFGVLGPVAWGLIIVACCVGVLRGRHRRRGTRC